MVKNNGAEEIGLVTPTPGLNVLRTESPRRT